MSTYAFAKSPFSGLSLAEFGFEVPPGNPGSLEAAAAQAQAAAARLESNARTVRGAVGATSADWTGVAHSSFAAYAGHLVSVYAHNSELLARAGKVLSGLARELESAQRQTRQAQDQCSHYHALAQTQTQKQQQHTDNANQLHLHASLAAHPHIHAQLKLQAQAEQQLADQAATAASQAQSELATWTKHGRDAYTTYHQHAHTAASTLSGLKAELRHPQRLHGSQLLCLAPIPVAVRQIVAQSFLPGKARFTAYPSQVLPLTKTELEHAKHVAAYQQAHGTEPLLPLLGLTAWQIAHPAKTQALLRGERSYLQAQTAEYDAMLNPLSHQNLAVEGGLIKAMVTPTSAEDIAHGHAPSWKHLLGDAIIFTPVGKLAKAGEVLKAAEAADESMTAAKTADTAGKTARASEVPAEAAGRGLPGGLNGDFSITDWRGYPTGGPKPAGPFRLVNGAEYQSARRAADATNRSLHAANPELKGLQIHEVHPIKFGGSPTELANKVALSPEEHARYTVWWNRLLRNLAGP